MIDQELCVRRYIGCCCCCLIYIGGNIETISVIARFCRQCYLIRNKRLGLRARNLLQLDSNYCEGKFVQRIASGALSLSSSP